MRNRRRGAMKSTEAMRAAGESVPDLYVEMHRILRAATKHLEAFKKSYKPAENFVRGAKVIVDQATAFCQIADGLREHRAKGIEISTQVSSEDIEADMNTNKRKGKEEEAAARIKSAEEDVDELAVLTSGNWPKEAFVATTATSASIQSTRLTRAIIAREGSAGDAEKLLFLEKQFPGVDPRVLMTELKIGMTAKLESASTVSFRLLESGEESSAPNRSTRDLFLGKISGAPCGEGPLDHRELVAIMQKILDETNRMKRVGKIL